jgi:hypothetical protein
MILPARVIIRPSFFEANSMKRRDVWPNREEAFEAFRKKTFNLWDERCIRLFVVSIPFS